MRYKGYYGGRVIELEAENYEEAHEVAVAHFKPEKKYDERLVHVMLSGYSLKDDMVKIEGENT